MNPSHSKRYYFYKHNAILCSGFICVFPSQICELVVAISRDFICLQDFCHHQLRRVRSRVPLVERTKHFEKLEYLFHRNSNLMHIIDRISIEKTLLSNTNESLEDFKVQPEDEYDGLICTDVFDKYKCVSYHVPPGGPGKVRRREYRRKSKGSEGANFQCFLCGSFVYKLYNTSVEKYGRSDNVQVCRKCFVEQNGGKSYITVRGEVRTRPHFDHTFCGTTVDRASDSWHFLRKGFIEKKRKALLNQQCNEFEYNKIYASDSENCMSSSDDESVDNSDQRIFVPKKVLLPFQVPKDNIGIDSASSSDVEKTASSDSAEIDNILQLDKFSITLENATFPPLSSERIPVGSKRKQHDNCENNASKIPQNNYNEAALLLENSSFDVCLSPTKPEVKENFFTPIPNSDAECFYFDDIPSNFRETKDLSSGKRKREKSVFNGLCSVVTILNKKSGHLVQNTDNRQLYDRKGFARTKKDFPKHLALHSNEMQKSGNNFQLRKSELDQYLRKNEVIPRSRRKGLKYVNVSMKCNSELPSTKTHAKHCSVCCGRLGKWYMTYKRQVVPSKLAKFFTDDKEYLFVCPNCNSKFKSENIDITQSNRDSLETSQINTDVQVTSDKILQTNAMNPASPIRINLHDKSKPTYYLLQPAASNGLVGKSNISNEIASGQVYRIDSEINFNDLVKENENAVKASDRKILTGQWPSILRRTEPGKYKIINLIQQPKTALTTNNLKNNENLSGGKESRYVALGSVKIKEGANIVLKPFIQTLNSQTNTSITPQMIKGPTSLLANNTSTNLKLCKSSIPMDNNEKVMQGKGLKSSPMLASEIRILPNLKGNNSSSGTKSSTKIQSIQCRINNAACSSSSKNNKRGKEGDVQVMGSTENNKCIRI